MAGLPEPLPKPLEERFRQAAADLPGVDHEAYRQADRDPQSPVLGLGHRESPIAFFGRDPGRDEVRHGVPFIGAGGKQIRRVLYRRRFSGELANTEQALAAGEGYFWANTVPYKPAGNKAWPMAVKRRFWPLVSTVLLRCWSGSQVLTLGREAFFWFGLEQSASVRQSLSHHWHSPARFETSLAIDYAGPEPELKRRLWIHPLPHPSPLNATWFKRFPSLLESRLDTLEAE